MIRVYYLNTETVNGVESIRGIQYVHDAVLDMEGKLHKLIQDTTDEEHSALIAEAEKWREATEDEIKQLNEFKKSFSAVPTRDLLKEIDEIKTEIKNLKTKLGMK